MVWLYHRKYHQQCFPLNIDALLASRSFADEGEIRRFDYNSGLTIKQLFQAAGREQGGESDKAEKRGLCALITETIIVN